MKTQSVPSTRSNYTLPSLALLTAGLGLWACTAEFKNQCPDGTEQTAGGGDISDACTPIAGQGGAGGAGGQGGAGGAGGQGGGAAGVGGQGGVGGVPTAGAAGSGQTGGSGGVDGSIPQGELVGAGGTHTCVQDQGVVRCWGSNLNGQLGTTINVGSQASNTVPSLVDSGLLNGVRQLAVSGNSNCALRDDGRVLCWGNNGKGALGTNINFNTANPNPVPTLIDNLVLGTVRQLALGSGSHNCALREDGRVLCWGNNYSGQLGIAINVQSTEGYPIPTVVDQDELGVVQQIALGGFHTCALRNDGRVLCWGLNTSGQLGVNTNLGASTANTVPALVDNSALGFVRQLALGSDHSCALRDDGRVLCWGSTLRGKLGNSNNAATDTPDPEPTLIDNSALGIVQQVAVGTDHSCALREDGRVLCWGGNSRGQLGNSVNIGTVTPNPAPTLVDNGELGTVRRLAIGDFHSCALRDDGRVLCWGSNLNGILGSAPNDTGVDSRNPVPTLVGGLPPLAPSSSPLSRALFSQTISRTTMYAFRSPAQLRKAA